MRISQLLINVFLRAGLFLLGDMLWQVGMTDILASFRGMGWWMVLWILLESVPVLLHMRIGPSASKRVYGLAFGLMARFEGLVWNGFGLLAYVWYTPTWCGLRRAQPIAS